MLINVHELYRSGAVLGTFSILHLSSSFSQFQKTVTTALKDVTDYIDEGVKVSSKVVLLLAMK